MKATSNNPPTNKLGSGLTETKILAAVSKSGYPLQARTANILRSQFHVQEEWTFIDKDTQELRAIDILAEQMLFDFAQLSELRVRPTLDLIIECKKSDLPYVFFLSPSKPRVPYFPLLAGLFKHTISVTTDDDPSSWNFNITHAFELESHPFMKEPEYCTSFTKCVRKGRSVEFSGSESFHGLILPTLKAMHEFQTVESPSTTAMYFDLHIIIGIGLLEAPMVGVQVSKQSHRLTLLPWVRVIRHETDQIPDWLSRTRLFAIEIVHKDFLEEYLKKHLLPFAKEVSSLAIKHQQVLASGEAFAKGMGKDCWHNIERRLKPRKIGAKASRLKATGRNIFRILFRRKPAEN